ncbi:hypothetical protein GSI_04316 [Ganoderma sinense ZZ0214-1]|uniref:Uncharacterized protein n=1 Tax=Ganoderma sinense ZZ0214-1 TaxID=1077348 RepID=A0A2G8SIU9_9APHY|nr:hypothetical protein GSI_04316 [Ganoderma sinense ZZ0214-1]
MVFGGPMCNGPSAATEHMARNRLDMSSEAPPPPSLSSRPFLVPICASSIASPTPPSDLVSRWRYLPPHSHSALYLAVDALCFCWRPPRAPSDICRRLPPTNLPLCRIASSFTRNPESVFASVFVAFPCSFNPAPVPDQHMPLIPVVILCIYLSTSPSCISPHPRSPPFLAHFVHLLIDVNQPNNSPFSTPPPLVSIVYQKASRLRSDRPCSRSHKSHL